MRDVATDDGTGTGPDQKALVDRIMKRQAALSIQIGVAFVVLLIGLPLVNLYNPALMATPVGGFTLSWLLLGILVFPVTWALSTHFVNRSNALEEEIVQDERGSGSVV